MKIIKYSLIVCCLLFYSCIKDIDLDQIDDIEINTTHIVSLVHFTLGSSSLLDDLANEALSISDTTIFPVFVGPYNENYLVQADFNYKFTNTFNRLVTIQYGFLDEFDNSIYTFQPINIAANSTNFEVTQTIVEADIPLVLPTDKIVINIVMDSGTPMLDPSQNYSFNMQSAATLTYRVTVDE